MFHCKGTKKGPCNYAINEKIVQLKRNTPHFTVLLYETNPGWNQSGGPEILTTDNHKGKGCNILFVDMHIQFVRTEYLKDLKWEPD
jgi:prepilin-type processing-associated H-X9-DG protein